MTQAATLLEQAGDSAMKQKVKDVEEAFGFNPAPFSLEAIVSSKKFPPQKVVVYGVPGVGKTSFAATWPDPILSAPKTVPELLTYRHFRKWPAP